MLISQHRGDLPVEALGPLRGVLVTGIGVICLHKDPAFNRARCMPTLPGFALGEGAPVARNFLATISW